MRNLIISSFLVVLSLFLIKEGFDINVYDESTILEAPIPVNNEPVGFKKDVDSKPIVPQAPPNLVNETIIEPAKISVESSNYNQVPVLESEINKEREELLNQVRPDTLVSCQTEINFCEPKNSNKTNAENSREPMFCVTYARNCLDEKTIGRIYTYEEIFPAETEYEEEGLNYQESYDPQIQNLPSDKDEYLEFQKNTENNSLIDPRPSNLDVKQNLIQEDYFDDQNDY